MKKLHKLAAVGAAALMLLTACGGGDSSGGSGGDGGGDAEFVFHHATMIQPNVPSAPVESWFYDQLEERSDGRIKIDRTEPDSICPANEVAECIRDGRADIGTSIIDYSPQMFPSLTLVSVPFMVDNSQALMQTLYKMNTENEDAVAKWDEIGLKYVAAWGPGKLIVGGNKPIRDLSDVENLRTRVTGGFLQRAFEGGGANVVALTAPETYEGIERGMADAVAWTMDGPVDYKMIELLSDWRDPGIGHYTAFSLWINKDKFDALPDDLKAIVDEVAAELSAGEGMKKFNEMTTVQCDTLLAHPNMKNFEAWNEADTNAWRDEVQQGLLDSWVEDATKNGLNNAEQYLAEYEALIQEASEQPDLVQDPVETCIERFQEGNN